MNERIKLLAKQCWDERPEGQLHFDNEKFAELIVKECIQRVENAPTKCAFTTYDLGMVQCAIKQCADELRSFLNE